MTDEKANNLEVDSSLGHYRILKKIGAGGMGEVYLATDKQLERNIALKVLPAEFCCDVERVRRFKQEARAASALNHPNILTIHEIGEVEDRLFIATEFIDGETLREKIRKNDLTVYESVRIAEQVAAGLSVAHSSNIIHRDIKPENIMIRSDGYAKILDFGLAKLVEKKPVKLDAEAETRAQVNTRPGMVMGSVSYMSPEQARGRNIDERTDIWSLGVCLYEMLTGKNPFAGETISDSLAALIHVEPEPLDENLPTELQRIARKTLQKDAGKRYQTIKDLLIDLEDAAEELKFQNKLERTVQPNREETKTQILNATTTDAAQATSSAEYIATEIKRHKSFSIAALLVLLLAISGLGYWFFANRSANNPQIESIAVMPFVNESGSVDVEYLSDGMTETLINSLSQIPELSVKARSSVFRYKGKDIDPQQIGNELSVQAILSGRVLQRGDNISLNLELVDVKTGNQIWGEQYNRKTADLVVLQSEIARDVSNKLQKKLAVATAQNLAKKPTTDSEAYQLYLKGLFHWNKRTAEELKKAIEYFNQAKEKDPSFALAYAGLAVTYSVLPNNWAITKQEIKETNLKAKAAALKALELDNTLAEAHTVLAIEKIDEWDFVGAENEYKRAIELNPNYATAHQWYSELLARLGRHDEAVVEIKKAYELDPFSPAVNMSLGMRYLEGKRYDEAIAQFKKTIEMSLDYSAAHLFLGSAYFEKGMYEEFIASISKARVLVKLDTPESAERKSAELRQALKTEGAKGYWRKTLEYELEYYEKGVGSPAFVAGSYARLGEKEKAFEWLEKAYAERDSYLIYLKTNGDFDPLRFDPRFKDLLRRIGLPQ